MTELSSHLVMVNGVAVPDRRHRPRSPADYFSFERFGGPTRISRGTATVGTSVIEVFQNNPNRVLWWITNNSGVEITVDWTSEILAGTGIILGQNGSFISQSIQEDGNAVGDAVFLIAASGGNTVFTFEVSVIKILARST